MFPLFSCAFSQVDWFKLNPAGKSPKLFTSAGRAAGTTSTADPDNHRLFVPRSTHTMILDADSGKILGDVPGQKIAHGVAIVPKLNRGFITDGGGVVP